MYHYFCIHSFIEGYLRYFQLLAIIKKASMKMVMPVSLLYDRASFGYMPSSSVAVSSGNSTTSNFMRNRQTDFQSGCTSLQPHQQWRCVPLSPHLCQHLLSHEFLILAILTGVKQNLRVALICISLGVFQSSYICLGLFCE